MARNSSFILWFMRYIESVGMRIITPPLATTIFLLSEYDLPSELARQAFAQPTIED
jgi:hypothetical protein